MSGAPADPAASGSWIGEFELVRRLGAGGMGQVWAARRPGARKLVALKLLPLTDPTALYRFKHEFRVLADVTHQNLVQLGELAVLPSGRVFYTMELVEGLPFVKWVRRKTMPGLQPNPYRIHRALTELIVGVRRLHELSRVHRDIKPSNVLVTREGRVVILDFGLVLEVSGLDSGVTGEGLTVGTPAYMAPEQADAAEIGPSADMYSIGVMLFESLTGSLPFVGRPMKIMLDKQQAPAPDPAELTADIPEWLRELCRSLLAVDPEDRPSAAESLEVLGAVDVSRLQSAASELEDVSDEDDVPEPRGRALEDLIGREAELELLEHTYARLSSELRPIVLAISGPSGRGKSALVHGLLRAVRAEGEAVVFRGRCHARESVPYKGIDAIIDALSIYLRKLRPEQRASLRPRHHELLAGMFPVLAEVWPQTGRQREQPDPITRRELAIVALREVLARIGDVAPLVVFIDDFHWADLDSLRVLGELLLPPEPPTLLLILAFRTEAGESWTREILDALAERDSFRATERVDLELGPLDEAASRQLARIALGPGTREEKVAELARSSGGEPGVIAEKILASWSRSGSSPNDAGLTQLLLGLSPDGLRMLGLATMASGPIDVTVLLEAHGGGGDILAELVRTGLLRRKGDRIQTSHPRIIDLVVGELESDELPRLHLELAEVLERRGGEPELLADLFERGGDLESAARWTVEAAARAAESLAFARAEQLYRKALELRPADTTLVVRSDLELALAEQLGSLARNLEAAELLFELSQDAPPERALKLRLRAAEQFALVGHAHRALPLLREALAEIGERLPDSRVGAVLALIWNSLRLAVRGRGYELRDEQRVPPSLLERFDLLYTALLAVSRQQFLLTAALRPRLLALALDVGEPRRLATAWSIEASTQAGMGRIQPARELLGRAAALIAELDDPLLEAQLDIVELSGVYLSRPADAEPLFERLFAHLDASPRDSYLRAFACALRSRSLRLLGEYTELVEHLPRWSSVTRSLGQHQSLAQLLSEEVIVHVHLGQLDDARRALGRARDCWRPNTYTFQHFMIDIAEVILALAEAEHHHARELLREAELRLRRAGQSWFRFTRARIDDVALRIRFRAAIARSEPPASRPSLAAIRRLRRSGIDTFVALGGALEGGYLSLAGRPADAREVWRRALVELEALSMSGYVAAVRWRLAELDGDDAHALRTAALRYFMSQGIEDPQAYADLLIPARSEDPGDIIRTRSRG